MDAVATLMCALWTRGFTHIFVVGSQYAKVNIYTLYAKVDARSQRKERVQLSHRAQHEKTDGGGGCLRFFVDTFTQIEGVCVCVRVKIIRCLLFHFSPFEK